MSGRAAAALRTVARFDLGAPVELVHDAPLAIDEWNALLHDVRRERLVLVLDAAVRAGDLPATREQAEALLGEAEQARAAVHALDELLVEVAAWLTEAGVDLRVLKGPAVARLDLQGPNVRSYADVDVLVRGSQLAAALSVLADHGFHRDLPERRPGYDARFAKEVSLAHAAGREIDVHRLLALGAVGTAMDLDALWARSSSFGVEEVELRALDAEGRFVHACINAALGDPKPRLVALRDVVQIARANALDVGQVAQLLPPGRGAAVVERARAHVSAHLDVPVAFPEAAGTASRWERTALRSYRAQGGSNTLELLSGALGLRSWRQRVAFLAGLAVPSASYRRARAAAGRPREVTTAVGELVSSRHAGPLESRAAPTTEAIGEPRSTTLPSRRPGLGVVELDGETVVWDPVSGRVTRLDGIASLVWANLDGTTPVPELVDDLAYAFDADRHVVEADVTRLVARLVTVGLAEWTRMEP